MLSAIPALVVFACTPVAVYDGDGPIWCAEGPRVRLAGIAAREMDGTCRANQPCPSVTAAQSRDGLAGLLGRTTGTMPSGHVKIIGPTLRCTSTGSAGGVRTGAWCHSPVHGDLSCKMVYSGNALKWQKYWNFHKCG